MNCNSSLKGSFGKFHPRESNATKDRKSYWAVIYTSKLPLSKWDNRRPQPTIWWNRAELLHDEQKKVSKRSNQSDSELSLKEAENNENSSPKDTSDGTVEAETIEQDSGVDVGTLSEKVSIKAVPKKLKDLLDTSLSQACIRILFLSMDFVRRKMRVRRFGSRCDGSGCCYRSNPTLQSNPESTVGVLCVLVTPTNDLGKILACMHERVVKSLGLVLDVRFFPLILHPEFHEELKPLQMIVTGLAVEGRLCCCISDAIEILQPKVCVKGGQGSVEEDAVQECFEAVVGRASSWSWQKQQNDQN